jgi:hypothetical protein
MPNDQNAEMEEIEKKDERKEIDVREASKRSPKTGCR